MSEINFFSEDIEFTLSNKKKVRLWLQKLIANEGKILDAINYIFCSDAFLHNINRLYLSHDTLTDIITFPYGEQDTIMGDIFISIDRVRENAVEYTVSFEEEMLRVMSHGIFHMCGYTDKSEKEKEMMRRKEEEAISVWLDA